jgi:hypothetical protein
MNLLATIVSRPPCRRRSNPPHSRLVGWRVLLTVPLLTVSTIACVQRVEPFFEVRITAVVPPAFEGDVGYAHGVVTNLADFPMDFEIPLAGLSLEPVNPVGEARGVLSGQTAVWRAPYVHPGYTPRMGTVRYTRVWPTPVHGKAVITGVAAAEVDGYTEVKGSVTNTGTDVSSAYAVDLQATNGEVTVAYTQWRIEPGQTVPWHDAIFRGSPEVRIVRVSYPSFGPPFAGVTQRHHVAVG